jgi:NAD-dependent SIR2 family protein deacetylase
VSTAAKNTGDFSNANWLFLKNFIKKNMTCHDVQQLGEFIFQHPILTVLVGAGCSTGSGIPEYRDDAGNWKHAKPVQYQDFVQQAQTRQRYWARSLIGWSRIAAAHPNSAHFALAQLENAGYVEQLITQNVDNLHHRAGSRNVINLHGVLEDVCCLNCEAIVSRRKHQQRLQESNPDWEAELSAIAPDGDANLSRCDFDSFVVPDCLTCGGTLKPDVVFFGESVPAPRVQAATDSLSRSDALLIVGSSLMVFSGYRFARMAREAGKPIAIVNRGITRADDIASLKFSADCGPLLSMVAERITA